MKKNIFRLCLLSSVFCLLISGCAKDNTPKPTPLSQIAPSAIGVKQIWSRSMSNGNDGQYLMIGSALQGTTLVTAGYDGTISALNVNNANVLWQAHLEHKVSATPGTNSTEIFVATKDGYLIALDLSNGHILWQTQLPSLALGAPSATDDVVVVLCHDSSVVALSADSGKILWSYQATAPSLTLYANSSPVIYNGMVYVGFDSGQLGAFDLYQGTEPWQVPIAIQSSVEAVQNMVDIDGTPAIDNGVLFVTSYHGTLSAVNMQNGQVIWQRKNSSFEAPVVQNGHVVVVDETGRVQAFDESTGTTLWQQKDLLYRFISNPVIINNEVVVGDYAGYVHFMSLNDGHLLARYLVSNKGITAAPIVYNGQVIITTDDGKVVVLKPLS